MLAFPRTAQVDRLVVAAANVSLAGRIAQPFALLAVGGYGRRELFPFSDVDLLLLLQQEPDAALKDPFGLFLRTLWDSSLKASHSVRTIDDCCRMHEGNLHLSISLLDTRFICGDAELFESLASRLPEFFRRHSRKLLRALADLTAGRHAKFGHTVYHLEPNIKEGPGGIRDIHFLNWAAQLAPGKEPLQHAVSEAESARDFFYRLRFFLHERSGRDNNLLSFELQDQAAAALPPSPLSPENWMRDVYHHARKAFQSSLQVLDLIGRSESGLVRQFFERRDRLSTGQFTVSHNQLFLRNPASTLSSLPAVFELFSFVARQGIAPSWDTLRRLHPRAAAFQDSDAARVGWREWLSILAQPRAALALRNMQESGLLPVVLPEWRSIESLVVRDFYHRYTVDEHTLVAIESIDNLLANAPGTPPRFRELALEEENPALLRAALLLHDIGKGITPSNHVRGSLDLAAKWLVQLDVDRSDIQTVLFLIAHHLDLSIVMNGRDLDDPATARFLSSKIGTYEDLRKLTLLTYADVSAVNPTAMTPWRVEQLWRVHTIAAEQLTRELASQRIHQSAHSTITTLARPELAHFLEGFPTRYLRIHSSEEIEAHFRLEQARLRDGVALEIRRQPAAYSATVLSADHPGLFAALCGTLASFGMNIVKAEAASNANGCALDEFRFTDPSRTLELNPEEIDRLRWTVECVIRGALDVGDLLKRRRGLPRVHGAARVAPFVRFDNDASDSSTLLNFSGEDRPGLLFDLASILTAADCNIELVLVNTEGHRAIDVLYVTKAGRKLDSETQDSLISQLAREISQ